MNRIQTFLSVILLLGLVQAACGGSAGESESPAPEIETVALAETPPLPEEARTFYVAANEPGANNDNNGLHPTHQSGEDGPWLTIQHAANTMQAGDVTYIRGGTYYEEGITFAHSGAPGQPITLANYQGEAPILDGSKTDKEDMPGIMITGGQGYYVIEGLTVRHMAWSGIGTEEEPAARIWDITIRDCILHNNGWSGIDLHGVDGFLVEGVESFDNAYYGMNIATGSRDESLSAANGIVRESSFYNHTGEEGHGLAINQGHDITVSDCVAYHNRTHGFDVSDWPKKGELSYNIIIENSLSYDNGLVGFAINSDSHHVVFRNNIAWKNGAEWAGLGVMSGFVCYEGCWHVEWINNVSIDNSDAGFWVEEGLGKYGRPGDNTLVFRNNIAYNNDPRGYSAALVIEGKNTWDVTAEHNNWSVRPGFEVAVYDQGAEYSPEEINSGVYQSGNISVGPQFVDPAEPDVHLLPGSPCIDAGVDVGLPYAGAAPDMGAFEFE
jgi:hypothetical protein